MTAHAPHKPGAAGKMSLVVHSTLADVPFTVELVEPTAFHLRQYVGAQCDYHPEHLRLVRRHVRLDATLELSLPEASEPGPRRSV